MSDKPTIQVTCAIIERDGLILAAQRSASMSMPLKWEFPGGKIKDLESAEECIKRELKEELSISVSVVNRLKDYPHNYDNISINLIPFICTIEDGHISLSEHRQITWLPPHSLLNLDWAEADLPIVKDIIARNGYI